MWFLEWHEIYGDNTSHFCGKANRGKYNNHLTRKKKGRNLSLGNMKATNVSLP